jgi:hypothetical protein
MSNTTLAGNADGIDDLNKLEAAWVRHLTLALHCRQLAPLTATVYPFNPHSFYTSGYEAGFEHGRAHGVFEGRALGQEKGFETFEELYYYAGQARFWQAVAQEDIKKRKWAHIFTRLLMFCMLSSSMLCRALPHILAILTMIDNFPTQNSSADPGPENDTEVLIQSIRSKYRVMCASLAIRPRLQKADMSLWTNS